jgi:PAS domain S-box-containing protein
MKRGATDYLLKDRLARLGQAVEHALRDARDRDKLRQAEEELRSTQEKLRQLLAHSPAVIYTLRIEGQNVIPVLVSDNIEPLLGFTVAETMSFDWWLKSLHPEDRDRVLTALAKGVAEDGYSVEYRIRHKNGTYHWIEDSNRVVRDASGQPKEFVGVWIDISERKSAEEVLRKQSRQETGRKKSRVLRDLVVIFTLGVLAVAGLYCTDVIQTQIDKIITEYDEQKHLDELLTGLTVVVLGFFVFSYRRWREIKSQVGERASIEEALRTLHGELEKRIQQRTAELTKANDALRTEITERKRAEQTSRQLANIVESSNDAIIGETLEGIVTSWNRAAESIFGYTAAEMIGRPIAVLLPPDRAEEERTMLDRIAGGDEAYHLETRRVRKDGVQIDVSATLSPIRDADGKIVGASKIGRDITAKKRAELELEQTHNQLLAVSRQAGIAEFATGVLHNVGNVLNSVAVASTCMSDSLKRSKSADLARVVALMQQHEADLGDFFTHNPQGKQVPGYLAKLAERLTGEQATALKELGELQKNVEHIKNIISVQQDSAKMSRSPEALKLTDLVEDALNVNSNGLRPGGIQVTKEFAEVPPSMVEKHKVLQILVNLVRNAMQACETSVEQEKRLAIRVGQEAGRVRIAVTDNGSGIAPENLSRIFAHGFTTKKDGHGFGLYGAARAAKEMGGSLAVQSEGPGRGATFTLELPMKG